MRMIFSANGSSAYCWQTFWSSFSLCTSSGGSGITAKPSWFSCFWSFGLSVRFSSLQEPLKAPGMPFGRSPLMSHRPALSVKLTRGPKAGQRRMHIAQPFPYFVQFPIGPVEPVVSTNTSPSKISLRYSPPCAYVSATTARRRRGLLLSCRAAPAGSMPCAAAEADEHSTASVAFASCGTAAAASSASC